MEELCQGGANLYIFIIRFSRFKLLNVKCTLYNDTKLGSIEIILVGAGGAGGDLQILYYWRYVCAICIINIWNFSCIYKRKIQGKSLALNFVMQTINFL